MEPEQKIKMMAESKLFGVTRLIKIGGSYCITLPKRWIDFNSTEIEGRRYCSIEVVGDNIIFKPIDMEEVEDTPLRLKKEEKTTTHCPDIP